MKSTIKLMALFVALFSLVLPGLTACTSNPGQNASNNQGENASGASDTGSLEDFGENAMNGTWEYIDEGETFTTTNTITFSGENSVKQEISMSGAITGGGSASGTYSIAGDTISFVWETTNGFTPLEGPLSIEHIDNSLFINGNEYLRK